MAEPQYETTLAGLVADLPGDHSARVEYRGLVDALAERDAARSENLRLVAASSIVADQAFRDGGDAARAEVERLTRQRDDETDKAQAIAENVVALSTEVTRLRAALRPFVATGYCHNFHRNADRCSESTMPREHWCHHCVASVALSGKEPPA